MVVRYNETELIFGVLKKEVSVGMGNYIDQFLENINKVVIKFLGNTTNERNYSNENNDKILQ